MSSSATSITEYGLTPVGLNVTRDFSAFLATVRFEDLPEAAVHQARRGALDWIGCTLAASPHPTIAKLLAVIEQAGGSGSTRVLGHAHKLALLDAAVANGQMGHLLDYDDTHMGGVVLHASSPILAALFALIDGGGIDGRTLIAAYAAGFEASVRIGQAAPGHYDRGWHLTGTLGTIGAGAACGRLLGLAPQQMVHALGLAGTQASGMQQNRGTMAKSFHAGKAAANGLLAALLAQGGFDSSPEIIEGKNGFCRTYSDIANPELVLDGLGSRWEIVRNGFKPYACGVVLHPAIDAVIALAQQAGLEPAAIKRVELRVHPHAVKITGVREPNSGLQAKFSIYHSAAAAYLDHAAGIAQYTDARALAPDVVALRKKIEVVTDENFRKDQAHATLVTQSGQHHAADVAHASGTIDNPMSDRALEAKFLASAGAVIGADNARGVADRIWQLETIADIRTIVDHLVTTVPLKE